MQHREDEKIKGEEMTQLLLDAVEIMGAVKQVDARWQGYADDYTIHENIAKAQHRKTLLGVGKKVKRMDGTTYLVPDYKKYREALKEIE